MNKKGVSPLIATVLLIGFAVVVAGLIYSWVQGDLIGKTQTNAEEQIGSIIDCSGVSVKITKVCDTSENKVKFNIKNTGSKTIKSLSIVLSGSLGSTTTTKDEEGNEDIDLIAGTERTLEYPYDPGEIEALELISFVPVINNVQCTSNVVMLKKGEFVSENPVTEITCPA